MDLTNGQTEAIACVDAHLENNNLPTYSQLLRRLANVDGSVKSDEQAAEIAQLTIEVKMLNIGIRTATEVMRKQHDEVTRLTTELARVI